MKKTNRIFEFIKYPNIITICIVGILTCLFVVGSLVMVAFSYSGVVSYIVYAFAAIFTAYFIYCIIRQAPLIKQSFVKQVKKHKFTNNLMNSYGFRTTTFAVSSSVINIIYAVFNGITAIISSSWWYGIFAGYYLILSMLRLGILIGGYKAKQKAENNTNCLDISKLKIYMNCGISLLVLEIALSAVVTAMIVIGKPTDTGKIVAIMSAAYTFYKLTVAIVNIFKVRKLEDPLLQCFRNINLTDATVSLLALQTTMIPVFSQGEESFNATALNSVMGFAVCVITVFLGIFMIIKAKKNLRTIKEGNVTNNEE